jgi:UDP-N-acetylglucosamine acyltransferase
VTIHSATGDGEATVIGSHNNILASSHIGHNIVIGNHAIISMAGLAGHVVVEDFALVGGMTGVHQFCRIGKMAIVGGCSAIRQDVAPFMLVEGNPPETRMVNKIGLERNGVPVEAQAALKQAHKILFREGLTTSNALARIEQEVPPLPEVQYLVQFVRTSERGVIK